MLSMTAQYALRAFVYIAGKGDKDPVLAKEIAAKTGVPSHYLSRILRDAVRAGLLDSARGVGGGFRLARPRNKMSLSEILAPFDDIMKGTSCPFGQPKCNDRNPCGFHEFWKPISSSYRKMLDETTLASVGIEGLSGSGRSLGR